MLRKDAVSSILWPASSCRCFDKQKPEIASGLAYDTLAEESDNTGELLPTRQLWMTQPLNQGE